MAKMQKCDLQFNYVLCKMVQAGYTKPSQSRHITDPIKTFLLLTQRGSTVYKAKAGLCIETF